MQGIDANPFWDVVNNHVTLWRHMGIVSEDDCENCGGRLTFSRYGFGIYNRIYVEECGDCEHMRPVLWHDEDRNEEETVEAWLQRERQYFT